MPSCTSTSRNTSAPSRARCRAGPRTAKRCAWWRSRARTRPLRMICGVRLQGNAGGEIPACEPPRHLKITWEYGGQTSWVDLRIAKHGAGSHLTLEHTMFPDDHWKQFGPGATGVGWDLALVGVAQHLDTGSAKTAEEGMAWMMSDNGKAFVRESSDAWGAAAIAGGEDAAAAKAAVSRTTAAYTGS